MAFTASTWGQGRLLTGLSPGSSLSGFTAVITKANLPTSALDTGSLSCLNGGGDWRFSTDINGSTQLPCEIVTCVTNATASNTEFVAWVRFPTYASGTREVYAFWNKAGQSQPAVGAAFGRNAVWVDSAISSHLTESSGTVATDSAGNRNGTYNGALPTVGANFGQDINGTTDYITYGNTALGIATAFTFSLKIKPDTIGTVQQLFQADDTLNTIRNWQWRIDADGKVRIISFDSGGSIIANTAGTLVLAAGTEYIVNYVWDNSAYRSYINGSQDVSVASVTNILDLAGTGFGASVGGRQGGSGITDYFNGQAGDLDVIAGAFKTADKISSEYSNQNNPSTFWTAGAVFVPGGGTITVTGTTPNYAYASISGTIDLTPEIKVTGATPNYTYAAIAGTIELTPQITVTGATPNYTYTAISGTVESVGIISVTGATPNYAYTAISGDITLLGTITVTGDTPNYSYSAIRGTIQLGDGVYANSFIGFTPSQGTFNGIVKSSSFNGIINETSDFSGIVKSTTFLGVKE
jgi:hypothetical protein